MTRKVPSRFDADAIIADYKDMQRQVVALRAQNKHKDADHLLTVFEGQQTFRARRAAARADPLQATKAAAGTPDPDDARLLLLCLGLQLRDGVTLPPEVLAFLSRALIAMAINPKRATHAFGLDWGKHRPSTNEARDLGIAFRILELSKSHPINQSAKAQSAIEIAAAENRVSAAVAERAWKKEAGRFARSWAKTLAAKGGK